MAQLTPDIAIPARQAPLPDFVTSRIDNHVTGTIERRWAGQHLLHGRVPGPAALHLSSNDYLCLLAEHSLLQAQAKAVLDSRHQLLMSAAYLHGDTPTTRTERRLAQYTGAQDSILCQSGWVANVGLLQAIASERIPVYLDINAHMSLWQGAHAAKARAIAFRHNDVEHAERQISKNGQGVIAVDAVYSTNGSLCPLADFAELAERQHCVLVVDESHSLGTHGPGGAGVVAEYRLHSKVHFQTASLAKAFAGRAGLITCASLFKDYFAMESFPAIFSSSLFDHDLAWLNQAAGFLQQADLRRSRLHSNACQIRSRLNELGYDVSGGTEQIIALEPGFEPMTLKLRNALQARGIFGSVFCKPATALNRSLVRFSINSRLCEEDIERLITACADIRNEVELHSWRRHSRS